MKIHDPEGNAAQRSPGELATPVAAALALILAEVFGFRGDADLVSAVTVVVAFVPAVIKWLVS